MKKLDRLNKIATGKSKWLEEAKKRQKIMTEKQKLFVEIIDAWNVNHKSEFDFNEWLYQKHVELVKEEGFNSYQYIK